MARKRTTPTNETQKENKKMADRGTLGTLTMVEVSDDELDAARGGRGHGDYDNFLAQFIAADIRGTKVGFDGVKVQSIKTGLKSAIKRAEDKGDIAKDSLQVRGKDEQVYLVRAAANGDES